MKSQKIKSLVTLVSILILAGSVSADLSGEAQAKTEQRKYNDVYSGENLNHIAFPMGGIGAGMICIEGTGTLSNFSLRNKPEIFTEPTVFSAICVKGDKNVARVLEGPVPKWKIFGPGPDATNYNGAGNGLSGRTYGLPRFAKATFKARFPFAVVCSKTRRYR